jgi:hypothetical protein
MKLGFQAALNLEQIIQIPTRESQPPRSVEGHDFFLASVNGTAAFSVQISSPLSPQFPMKPRPLSPGIRLGAAREK